MKFWHKLEDIISPWEFLLFLGIGAIALDIPLAIAFQHTPSDSELALDILFSSLLTWDLVRHPPRRGIGPYQSLSKAFDVIAATPWLSLVVALGFRNTNLVIYIQALHLLRLPRLVQSIMERSEHKIFPKRFKFMVAGYITTVVLNGFACGWLMIYPEPEDPTTGYIKALYWLVTTIATVGYGDITPSTNAGRVYAMFIMVMGATIWGILIASASRMMLASDRRKEQRKEKMEALQSFFNHYEIPKSVQGQVIGFYHHLLNQKLSEDERAVMSELPTGLQSELQVYMNLKPISRVSLFQGVSFACLSSAAKKLEQAYFAPGDSIVKRGEVGTEMFLIGHGSVTVHSGEHFIATLGEGQCFGEFALIGEGVRGADVTAASYCDAFKLSKEKFDELYSNHADLRANIDKLILERSAKKITLKAG